MRFNASKVCYYVLLPKKHTHFNRLLYAHEQSTLKIGIEFFLNLPCSASVDCSFTPLISGTDTKENIMNILLQNN